MRHYEPFAVFIKLFLSLILSLSKNVPQLRINSAKNLSRLREKFLKALGKT